MPKESINLKGIVLHSPEARKELSRHFYQTLLGKSFKLEQHDNSPPHYSCWVENFLLELYPSQEKILSSFALYFSTTYLEAVLQRMQGSSFQPKAIHDRKNVTYSDPEDRNIRLNSIESSTSSFKLDEIALHTRHLSEARSFYQQLLEIPFIEQSYGNGQVKFYTGTNNGVVLKLWPDTVSAAPSPSLFLACSDLAQVRLRMENYSKDWKQINAREARLSDPDRRKMILYQE